MRVVAATGNSGKLRELAALLGPLGIDLIAQAELGVAPAPETASTFVENALGKARHAARATGLPAIADDSGLVVPALGGAPGVYSARYAGADADDAGNNAKLLAALADQRGAARAAFFYCVLVHLAAADDPAPAIATGRWDGAIGEAPDGASGFGYDPLFLPAGCGCSAARLPLAEKNARSHRGIAIRALAALLAP